MKLIDKVWLACAIDSEGCITLKKCHNHGYPITYSPRIDISNQSFEYLNKCKKITNCGRIYDYAYPGISNHRIISFVKQGDVKMILQNVYPYLVIKKKLARIVLRAIRIGFERKKNKTIVLLVNEVRKLNSK